LVLGGQSFDLDRWPERHRRDGSAEVRADDAVGGDHCEQVGHARADVGPVYGVALVSEAAHQLGPCLADAEQVAPARLVHRRREAVARQRWDDHVERISRICAVGGGLGERADHL
jgi:hypothetical protein